MGRREEEEGGDGGEGGFFACYLLTSLNPRFKGHTYIGFTVNPRRRIRQHNGEIGCGAGRTKSKRPWEMILCIHGFPTNISALKFEWAWQHPTESLAVRQAAATFKSLSGVPNKIKLAYVMLSLAPWHNLNMTVNYFSTKYKCHSAGCPSLPDHMKVKICPMDELPCYSMGDESTSQCEDDWDDSRECDEVGTADETLPETSADHDETNGQSLGWNGNYGNKTWDASSSEKWLINSPARISSDDKDTYPWIEDAGRNQLRDSPTWGNDCTEQFGSINSPPRVSSSIGNGTSNAAPVSTQDRETFMQTEDYSKRELGDSIAGEGFMKPLDFLISPVRATISPDKTETAGDKHTSVISAAKDVHLSSSSREVEFVDLLTPSPECRANPCSKKRSVSTACPEIIDLTRSPLFIQL